MLSLPTTQRYEGFLITLPAGQRYRAANFHGLVEKVRRAHPEISEAWLESAWCAQHPGQCVELPDIPADAPSRLVLYLQAMAARARSRIPAVSPEVYERDRIGVCLTFNAGQPCDQYRGEKGIGLISCKACSCTHLKGWAVASKCKLGRWKA